jgi:hypothetical protein
MYTVEGSTQGNLPQAWWERWFLLNILIRQRCHQNLLAEVLLAHVLYYGMFKP